MVFMGVSQHAEFDFDVRFARGDAHMLHPENTPEFNLKVALSPPGVLLVCTYPNSSLSLALSQLSNACLLVKNGFETREL